MFEISQDMKLSDCFISSMSSSVITGFLGGILLRYLAGGRQLIGVMTRRKRPITASCGKNNSTMRKRKQNTASMKKKTAHWQFKAENSTTSHEQYRFVAAHSSDTHTRTHTQTHVHTQSIEQWSPGTSECLTRRKVTVLRSTEPQVQTTATNHPPAQSTTHTRQSDAYGEVDRRRWAASRRVWHTHTHTQLPVLAVRMDRGNFPLSHQPGEFGPAGSDSEDNRPRYRTQNADLDGAKRGPSQTFRASPFFHSVTALNRGRKSKWEKGKVPCRSLFLFHCFMPSTAFMVLIVDCIYN